MPVKAPKGRQPNVPITELPDEWVEYTIQSASHPGVKKRHEAERTRRGTSWTNPVLQTQGYATPGAAALAAGSAEAGKTGGRYTEAYKTGEDYQAAAATTESVNVAREATRQKEQQAGNLQAWARQGGSRGLYAKYLSGNLGTGPKAQESLMRAMGQEIGARRSAAGLGSDPQDLYRMVSEEIRNLNTNYFGDYPGIIPVGGTQSRSGTTGKTLTSGAYIPSYNPNENYGVYKREERVSPYSFPETPEYLKGKGWEEIDKWYNWQKEPDVAAGIKAGTIIPGYWNPEGDDPKYGGSVDPLPGFASGRGQELLREHQKRLEQYKADQLQDKFARQAASDDDFGGYAAFDQESRIRQDQNRITDELGDYTPYSPTIPGTTGSPQYPDFRGFSGGGAGDQYTPGSDEARNIWGTDLGDTSDPNTYIPGYFDPSQEGGSFTRNPLKPGPSSGRVFPSLDQPTPQGGVYGGAPYLAAAFPGKGLMDAAGWLQDRFQGSPRTPDEDRDKSPKEPYQHGTGYLANVGEQVGQALKGAFSGVDWGSLVSGAYGLQQPQPFVDPYASRGAGQSDRSRGMGPDFGSEAQPYPFEGGGAPVQGAGAPGLGGMTIPTSSSGILQLIQTLSSSPEDTVKSAALRDLHKVYYDGEQALGRTMEVGEASVTVQRMRSGMDMAMARLQAEVSREDAAMVQELKLLQQKEAEQRELRDDQLRRAQTTGVWPGDENNAEADTLAKQQFESDVADRQLVRQNEAARLAVQQTEAGTEQKRAESERERVGLETQKWQETRNAAQREMSGWMDVAKREGRTLEGEKFDLLKLQAEAEISGKTGDGEATMASRHLAYQESQVAAQIAATQGLQRLQMEGERQATERVRLQTEKDQAINDANIKLAREKHKDTIKLEQAKLEHEKEVSKLTFIKDYMSDPIKHLIADRTGLIPVIERALGISFEIPSIPRLDGSDLGLPTQQLLSTMSPTDRELALIDASLMNRMSVEGAQWGIQQQMPGGIMPGYSWSGTGGAR